KHGGIRATQQIAKLAEAAGVPCTIGSNLEREVATAAMAHVTVCTANIQCERYPGDLIGPLYYEQALSRQPLRYQGGRLWVAEGGGAGHPPGVRGRRGRQIRHPAVIVGGVPPVHGGGARFPSLPAGRALRPARGPPPPRQSVLPAWAASCRWRGCTGATRCHA